MSINVFEALRSRPSLIDMGAIANPSGFSASCPTVRDTRRRGIDIDLRYNGEGFNDDTLPAQFRPAFLKAQKDFLSTNPIHPHCTIHLSQGLLAPGENFRVIKPHTDPICEGYPVNTTPEETHYVVSDALTTAFYDQTFQVPDYQFAKIEDIQWRLCEIFAEQVDPANRFVPEPYHMIKYSPYAVHEAQLPVAPTERTFMLVRFY